MADLRLKEVESVDVKEAVSVGNDEEVDREPTPVNEDDVNQQVKKVLKTCFILVFILLKCTEVWFFLECFEEQVVFALIRGAYVM